MHGSHVQWLESLCRRRWYCFFFFNDTATTEIYTLSLHDALPISHARLQRHPGRPRFPGGELHRHRQDRKSTRLNSSHLVISYAVFCLKKKKNTMIIVQSYTTHRRISHMRVTHMLLVDVFISSTLH